MPRREFTRKTKREAWERCKVDGVPCCEGVRPDGVRCGLPLQRGRFTYDHRNPEYFSKDNSLENCQILGFCCDKPKTKTDQRTIAKSRRIQDRGKGIKRMPRVPMPGSRASGWKKTFGNGWVKR